MKIEPGKKYKLKGTRFIVEVEEVNNNRVTFRNTYGARVRLTKSAAEFRMKYEEK